MARSYRVAVLEDNRALCEELLFLLEEESYSAEGFCHACDFLRTHAAAPFDLLLLDLGLPDRDGIEVARELSHSKDEVGIIILSARDTLDDRVQGLTLGADAYLGKPFEYAELMAHINALIRRKALYTPSGEWLLYMRQQRLVSPDSDGSNCYLDLNASEHQLLDELARQHPEPVTRIELIKALGEDYRLYDERRLEKLVSRLRKKLHDQCRSMPLKAVRGKGYVFSEPIRQVNS